MKKILLLIIVITAFASCKKDEKKETTIEKETEAQANETLMSGNFMYFEDAAVFQTPSDLYGVVQNEMLDDLILQSEPLKNEPSDEVAVVLKVKLSKKPENEEGWENRIEILEIVKVSKANPENNNIIKLGKEKNAENQ